MSRFSRPLTETTATSSREKPEFFSIFYLKSGVLLFDGRSKLSGVSKRERESVKSFSHSVAASAEFFIRFVVWFPLRRKQAFEAAKLLLSVLFYGLVNDATSFLRVCLMCNLCLMLRIGCVKCCKFQLVVRKNWKLKFKRVI